ncbi:Endo-1-3(4)-beta-glucanase [Penicillium canariense]|uniref:Endo-1-3(4)-beta-glucanase n=1 Tax=Penicillium canariense TaxID=189055 RepID=A0A9W9LII9_9EURO|nr:Endo-1-3(4)-beta-glucanase [Penicillium canariense]KAJ5159827.1 Endo-1-3(4)-beta-glucanase [Penicillium canariense]
MKRHVLSLGILGLAALGSSAAIASSPGAQAEATSKPPPKKDPEECDCFTVSGPDPGYFQHYKLWDFRSVPLTKQAHPDTSEPTDGESDMWTGRDSGGNENHDWVEDKGYGDHDDDNHSDHEPDALWFFETAFNKDWASQRWWRPSTPATPVAMINSKHNVFFTRNRQQLDKLATYLVLRTTRHWNYTSTAEIETRVRNIFHCSFRVKLRILPSNMVVPQPAQSKKWPPPDPVQRPSPELHNQSAMSNETAGFADASPHTGACVGIFTYHAHDCESDIEILTSDPPYRARYANQPDYDPVKDEMIPGASTIADLPVHWTTWSTHRLDWLSDTSRWWVDDKLLDSKTYRVPNLQSRLMINLWSDGGAWTGDMQLGASILLAIEYIELAYNRSSDGSKGNGAPPSQRHAGHQLPLGNGSQSDIEGWQDEPWKPGTELVDGAMMKKCKKGRKGRKCRKKNRKHGKGRQGRKHGYSWCDRPCNIDDLHFANGGLDG